MKDLLNKQITPFILAFLVAASLIPPWISTLSVQGAPKSKNPVAYAFILDPPARAYDDEAFGIEVDWSRLVLEYFSIIGIGAFVICIKAANKDKLGN